MKVGFARRKYGSVHFKRKTLHLHFRAWWKYLSTHSSKTWCEWGRIAESSLKKLWLKREIARCNPVYSSFDKLRKNNESLRKKFNFTKTTILKNTYQINLLNHKTCYMQINCKRLSKKENSYDTVSEDQYCTPSKEHYGNEVYLTGHNPPIKCYQRLDFQYTF